MLQILYNSFVNPSLRDPQFCSALLMEIIAENKLAVHNHDRYRYRNYKWKNTTMSIIMATLLSIANHFIQLHVRTWWYLNSFQTHYVRGANVMWLNCKYLPKETRRNVLPAILTRSQLQRRKRRKNSCLLLQYQLSFKQVDMNESFLGWKMIIIWMVLVG